MKSSQEKERSVADTDSDNKLEINANCNMANESSANDMKAEGTPVGPPAEPPEIVYPKGWAIVTIMFSVWLSLFLVALVSPINSFSVPSTTYTNVLNRIEQSLRPQYLASRTSSNPSTM
jgi:hypothetical protein